MHIFFLCNVILQFYFFDSNIPVLVISYICCKLLGNQQMEPSKFILTQDKLIYLCPPKCTELLLSAVYVCVHTYICWKIKEAITDSIMIWSTKKRIACFVFDKCLSACLQSYVFTYVKVIARKTAYPRKKQWDKQINSEDITWAHSNCAWVVRTYKFMNVREKYGDKK